MLSGEGVMYGTSLFSGIRMISKIIFKKNTPGKSRYKGDIKRSCGHFQ